MSAAKQPQPAAYRLLAADELGVLKVIEIPAGPKWSDAAVVQTWGEANKEQSINCVSCSASSLQPGTPGLVAVGRIGRRVDILDAHTGQQQASFAAAAPEKPPVDKSAASKLQVSAVEFIQPAGDRLLQLVVGTSDGVVSICSCSGSSSGAGDTCSSSSGSWSVSRSFQVGPNLTCMAVDSSGSHLLVGGEGFQPSLWDLTTCTKVWQAKGGKPNRVGLVDKAFTTSLAFLSGSSSSGGDAQGNGQQQPGAAAGGEDVAAAAVVVARRFIAGSVSAKLQVYDTAAGRRPQAEAVFGETRVTALAPEQQGGHVWAANGTGHIQVLNLQTNKLMDALKGAGGSVRALALSPSGEPLIASAGLDRFVRVHSTATKSGLCRVYLKQQLTGVCWLPVKQAAAATAAGAAAGDEAAAADTAGEATAAAAATPKSRKSKKKKKSEAAAAAADHADSDDGEPSGKKRRKSHSSKAAQ